MKAQAAKKFEDLIVWQKAHAFVLEVYRFTQVFPKQEAFGLTSQFRRAAVSIPANIAEGFVKKSVKDKGRFFNIAQGSLEECRYYLILVEDLKYGDTATLKDLIIEVSKILDAYVRSMLAPGSLNS
jgi:four helix bundle protein